MKKIIVALFMFVGLNSFAQPTSGDIIMADVDSISGNDTTLIALVNPPAFEPTLVSAFKAGNAQQIAAYFGDNVDLSIMGKVNLYSKSQAQQVLQHFFTEHPPKDFSIIHKGNAKTSQYYIGELASTKSVLYRVTLNCKKEGSKTIITSLTIEAN